MLKALQFYLLTALISGFAYDAQAQSHEQLPGPRDEIRTASELDYPPYSFVNHDGQPDGFSVELFRAAAKHAGLEIKNTIAPWPQVRDAIYAGEIDATPIMAHTPERIAHVELSDSYITAFNAIFIREKDQRRIRSLNDLKGKTVITLGGDHVIDFLRQENLVHEIIEADTVEAAFNLFNSGQGDAVIIAQLVGLYTLEKLKLADRIVFAEHGIIDESTRRFTFAVKKGDHELVNRLNEGLKAARATGEYRQLYDKWFRNLDPRERKRLERQRNLGIMLAATFLATCVALFFIFILRKQVERKTKSLADAEMKFRRLMQNMPGAAFQARLLNNQWHVPYVSDVIEDITGYAPAEFVSGRVKFQNLILPEDLLRMERELLERPNKSDRYATDFRIRHKNGSIRWIHGRSTNIIEDGKYIGFDGIYIDVTEQKRVSELLVQQQSKMAASARLSAIGEMAGGIAHEINNPLAIINLRTHQLSQMVERGKVEPDKVLDIATAIEGTSLRISRIVKSLQTVARESENDPFATVPFKTILSDALELCQQRMQKHGVELEISEFPENLTIECRHVQLSQVLINLLNNAFDAVVNSPVKKVRVDIIDRGNAIEVDVMDSGPGVSPEAASRIFQPFYTTKEVGKGVGLGLSISKGLIEGHGGEIWVDPASAEGARFVVILPKWQTSSPQGGRA